MKPRTTIILLILLSLAGSALLLLPRGTPTPPPTEEGAESKPLFDEDQLGPTIAVIRVFAKTSKKPDLVLVKKNGRWWVSSPHLFPAHRPALDKLLTMLAQVQAKPIGEDDAAYPGDEFHGRSLTLDYTDRPSIQVSLGERIGAGRARIGPDPGLYLNSLVAETDTTLHDYFDAFNHADYYAKKIDVPIMPDVESIDLVSLDERSILVQQDDGWFIGEGEDAERALAQGLPDTPGIDQLFKLFDLLELSAPLPAGTSLSAYGLENPLASITLGPVRNAPAQADNTITISLGVPADPDDTQRFISVTYDKATPPAVFTAPTQYALLVAQKATRFRDPRIITTPITLIDRVLLFDGLSGGGAQLIKLDQGRATLVTGHSGSGRALDKDRLASLLTALAGARASDYTPLPKDGSQSLQAVAIKPRLHGKDEVFEILADPASNPQEPTVLIRRGNEPVVLRVPREAVAGLLDPMSLVLKNDR